MERKSTEKSEAVPLHMFLSKTMDMAEVNNVMLAQKLGYKPNVVAMMRNGSMKVPMKQVGQIAEALKIDKIAFLQRVLKAYHPETWEALKEVMGDRLVTKNELGLLEVVRDALQGADVNLVALGHFRDDLSMMVNEQADRSIRETLATPMKEDKRFARDSKTSRYNKELAALLDRQAQEREELKKRLADGMEGAVAT